PSGTTPSEGWQFAQFVNHTLAGLSNVAAGAGLVFVELTGPVGWAVTAAGYFFIAQGSFQALGAAGQLIYNDPDLPHVPGGLFGILSFTLDPDNESLAWTAEQLDSISLWGINSIGERIGVEVGLLTVFGGSQRLFDLASASLDVIYGIIKYFP